VKDSRKTSTPKRLFRAACVLAAFAAGPALAHDSWVEDHVAAAYDYVLIKGPATGRTVLLGAADPADADAMKGKSAGLSRSSAQSTVPASATRLSRAQPPSPGTPGAPARPSCCVP
jgi:hypothetical protein